MSQNSFKKQQNSINTRSRSGGNRRKIYCSRNNTPSWST